MTTIIPFAMPESPELAFRLVQQCSEAYVNVGGNVPSPACVVTTYDGGANPKDGKCRVTFELDMSLDPNFLQNPA